VDVTLPVIAQGRFCSSGFSDLPRAESKGKRLKRSSKRESVAGDPGVAASSETVSHGETRPSWRDSDATALRCGQSAGARESAYGKRKFPESRQESAGWGNGEIHA